MDNPVLVVAMRYLHIVSAIVAVGGLAFMAWCLSPALRLLDDGFREQVQRLASERFQRVIVFAIGGLTLSGVYNWIMLAPVYREAGPLANALIGTKVLLSLVMFGIVFAQKWGLIVPSKFWRSFNLHLGALVILLAAVLRYVRLEHLNDLAAVARKAAGQ